MATRKTKVKRAVKKVVAKVKAAASPKKKKVAAKTRAAPAPRARKNAPGPVAKVSPQGRRTGKCETVDQYILQAGPPHRAVLETLRDVVMTAVPGASCVIKWNQPVFEYEGPLAYMKAFGKYVNFGFMRGAELNDPDRILEGTGSGMRHVKIVDPTLIPVAKIDALVRQAAALNVAKKAAR